MSTNLTLIIPIMVGIFVHLFLIAVIKRLWSERKTNTYLISFLVAEIIALGYLFYSKILTIDMFMLT
jgi:hypothetical protein